MFFLKQFRLFNLDKNAIKIVCCIKCVSVTSISVPAIRIISHLIKVWSTMMRKKGQYSEWCRDCRGVLSYHEQNITAWHQLMMSVTNVYFKTEIHLQTSVKTCSVKLEDIFLSNQSPCNISSCDTKKHKIFDNWSWI